MAGSNEVEIRQEGPYDTYRLLETINRALSQYEVEESPSTLCNLLLNDLLSLTDSEYGFIGELRNEADGKEYIKVRAYPDMDWDENVRSMYEFHKKNGLEFRKLDSLYGEVIKTREAVISNCPKEDPRSCGLPAGHPALNTFLGVPIHGGSEMFGIICLANRPGGYESNIIDYLQPFIHVCANLFSAYKHVKMRQKMEEELKLLKAQFQERSLVEQACGDDRLLISLGQGYRYDLRHETLYFEGHVVFLTPNEGRLFNLLVKSINRAVKTSALEAAIWKNAATGESSLRALVMRLRKKVPGIYIQTVTGIGYMMSE